ncbi:MAG: hypothetical protein DRG87_07385 [Deltaproteobacteria bacterium]|nr:MAG: hypothetical protein DRG87_07385 [Deltaproteobacteria bacterium]
MRGIAEANSELAVQNIRETCSALMNKRFLAALGTGSAISSILLKTHNFKGMRLLRFARNDFFSRG